MAASKAERDPLDMTVRELLAMLVDRVGGSANDEWVNIRSEAYPWRRIVAAAERGECEVSRVGRRLMMQRSELSRWLARHRIGPRSKKAKPDAPKDEFNASLQRALERNGVVAPKGKYAVVARTLHSDDD
jgi:hypothetical protein